MTCYLIKSVYYIFKGLFYDCSYDLLLAPGMLRCGQSNAYAKPECVCSFHNVYEATFYHSYSSCPEGTPSDMVTKLKCKLHICSDRNELKYPLLHFVETLLKLKFRLVICTRGLRNGGICMLTIS